MPESDRSGQAATPASPLAPGIDPETTLAALRERTAERFDPVRFRFIEALARRAMAHQGDARRILDGKLAKALTEYGERFEQAQGRAEDTTHPTPDRSPLADLVGYIAQRSSENAAGGPADTGADVGSRAELKSLRYFRNTWARLSVDQQLSQALAQAPKNAGPLNSHLLVLQSIKLMRDLSPDHLKRFVSYVDALLWLDHADSGSLPVQNPVVRGESEKKRKPARAKAK